MHSRRLASFLIGAWLAASIFMDFVAIQNFRSVDRFLNAPNALAAEQIRAMGGKANARVFLRHEAGEVNRFLFEQWEYVQIALGLLLPMVFVFGHGEAPKAALILTLIMVAIVGIDRFWLTPEISALGRLLDFPNPSGGSADVFWRLHAIYSGLELLKLALGFATAGALVIRSTDRNKFVREHEKIARQRTGTPARG